MRFLFIVGLVLICSSCALVQGGQEILKTIWGSSTRVLEKARDHAITRIYDKAYRDCVRNSLGVVDKQKWVIFKKDEIKGYMVLIGIKGCVDTTEVGVFFDALPDSRTRIDITSLSSNAKHKVAIALFHGLDISFGFLPPDPPEPTQKS